jgi:hypothetical protein
VAMTCYSLGSQCDSLSYHNRVHRRNSEIVTLIAVEPEDTTVALISAAP